MKTMRGTVEGIIVAKYRKNSLHGLVKFQIISIVQHFIMVENQQRHIIQQIKMKSMN